jgi:imidazolonepropionase-like amidohydrolase
MNAMNPIDATTRTSTGAGLLAVQADRLFDGVSAEPLRSAVVLIEDGRIVAVGSGLEPPADTEVIDLGRVT